MGELVLGVFFFAYLGCFFLQFLSLGDGRIWL